MDRIKSHKLSRPVSSSIYAVDLFCGAGGLTKGLEDAGIQVRLGIDVDPACEYPYTANNNAKFLLKSVNDLTAEDVLAAYPGQGHTLLAGCAPCQTFSTYYQKASKLDARWNLLARFGALILEVQPTFITMENVPKLLLHDVFRDFVRLLECSNYFVSYKVVNCADYGVPQQRNRLVLLASKLAPIELITPELPHGKKMTVRECIGKLPSLKAGEVLESDPLHQCSKLSKVNMARIKASKPGGNWREWKIGLIADCHLRETGSTYSSVYGRMKWDEPAPTITTQFFGFGNGRFGHPEQDRAISLREGAVLQSFPTDYRFVSEPKTLSKKSIGKLIGNAVPVKLGYVIGQSLVKHLENAF